MRAARVAFAALFVAILIVAPLVRADSLVNVASGTDVDFKDDMKFNAFVQSGIDIPTISTDSLLVYPDSDPANDNDPVMKVTYNSGAGTMDFFLGTDAGKDDVGFSAVQSDTGVTVGVKTHVDVRMSVLEQSTDTYAVCMQYKFNGASTWTLVGCEDAWSLSGIFGSPVNTKSNVVGGVGTADGDLPSTETAVQWHEIKVGSSGADVATLDLAAAEVNDEQFTAYKPTVKMVTDSTLSAGEANFRIAGVTIDGDGNTLTMISNIKTEHDDVDITIQNLQVIYSGDFYYNMFDDTAASVTIINSGSSGTPLRIRPGAGGQLGTFTQTNSYIDFWAYFNIAVASPTFSGTGRTTVIDKSASGPAKTFTMTGASSVPANWVFRTEQGAVIINDLSSGAFDDITITGDSDTDSKFSWDTTSKSLVNAASLTLSGISTVDLTSVGLAAAALNIPAGATASMQGGSMTSSSIANAINLDLAGSHTALTTTAADGLASLTVSSTNGINKFLVTGDISTLGMANAVSLTAVSASGYVSVSSFTGSSKLEALTATTLTVNAPVNSVLTAGSLGNVVLTGTTNGLSVQAATAASLSTAGSIQNAFLTASGFSGGITAASLSSTDMHSVTATGITATSVTAAALTAVKSNSFVAFPSIDGTNTFSGMIATGAVTAGVESGATLSTAGLTAGGSPVFSGEGTVAFSGTHKYTATSGDAEVVHVDVTSAPTFAASTTMELVCNEDNCIGLDISLCDYTVDAQDLTITVTPDGNTVAYYAKMEEGSTNDCVWKLAQQFTAINRQSRDKLYDQIHTGSTNHGFFLTRRTDAQGGTADEFTIYLGKTVYDLRQVNGDMNWLLANTTVGYIEAGIPMATNVQTFNDYPKHKAASRGCTPTSPGTFQLGAVISECPAATCYAFGDPIDNQDLCLADDTTLGTWTFSAMSIDANTHVATLTITYQSRSDIGDSISAPGEMPFIDINIDPVTDMTASWTSIFDANGLNSAWIAANTATICPMRASEFSGNGYAELFDTTSSPTDTEAIGGVTWTITKSGTTTTFAASGHISAFRDATDGDSNSAVTQVTTEAAESYTMNVYTGVARPLYRDAYTDGGYYVSAGGVQYSWTYNRLTGTWQAVDINRMAYLTYLSMLTPAATGTSVTFDINARWTIVQDSTDSTVVKIVGGSVSENNDDDHTVDAASVKIKQGANTWTGTGASVPTTGYLVATTESSQTYANKQVTYIDFTIEVTIDHGVTASNTYVAMDQIIDLQLGLYQCDGLVTDFTDSTVDDWPTMCPNQASATTYRQYSALSAVTDAEEQSYQLFVEVAEVTATGGSVGDYNDETAVDQTRVVEYGEDITINLQFAESANRNTYTLEPVGAIICISRDASAASGTSFIYEADGSTTTSCLGASVPVPIIKSDATNWPTGMNDPTDAWSGEVTLAFDTDDRTLDLTFPNRALAHDQHQIEVLILAQVTDDSARSLSPLRRLLGARTTVPAANTGRSLTYNSRGCDDVENGSMVDGVCTVRTGGSTDSYVFLMWELATLNEYVLAHVITWVIVLLILAAVAVGIYFGVRAYRRRRNGGNSRLFQRQRDAESVISTASDASMTDSDDE